MRSDRITINTNGLFVCHYNSDAHITYHHQQSVQRIKRVFFLRRNICYLFLLAQEFADISSVRAHKQCVCMHVDETFARQ